jgi:hypothetical protein
MTQPGRARILIVDDENRGEKCGRGIHLHHLSRCLNSTKVVDLLLEALIRLPAIPANPPVESLDDPYHAMQRNA